MALLQVGFPEPDYHPDASFFASLPAASPSPVRCTAMSRQSIERATIEIEPLDLHDRVIATDVRGMSSTVTDAYGSRGAQAATTKTPHDRRTSPPDHTAVNQSPLRETDRHLVHCASSGLHAIPRNDVDDSTSTSARQPEWHAAQKNNPRTDKLPRATPTRIGFHAAASANDVPCTRTRRRRPTMRRSAGISVTAIDCSRYRGRI